MLKRLFDLTCSGVAIVVTLPLSLLVAILIKFTSKGPIFFRQQRVGLHGKTFNLYKFRSMVVNAAELGSYQTKPNDQRITAIGRFIRKLSIDELPQLINVIKGEMSLVGPRPDVPAQCKLYSEAEWQQRCSVKPGITGLAQATFRSQATTEQRKNLDLTYTRKMSLWLDVKIIALTIKSLLNINWSH